MARHPLCSFLVFSVLFSHPTTSLCQAQVPTSDPQALALAQKSIATLTNGTVVTDATLTGNAIWIAGSDGETGTATLQAKGTGESRIDLTLSASTRTEIRNDSAGYPQGASVLDGGNQQAWPLSNCWTGASWFYPGLSPLAQTADPNQIFVYVGQETRNGASVYHLQTYRYTPAKKAEVSTLNRGLSTMDIYLDAKSLLPVAFTFNTHPDDTSGMNISTEIDFSNYQQMGGVLVPMHIQKLIWNGVTLDVTITGASFNAGIPDSQFTITTGQ